MRHLAKLLRLLYVNVEIEENDEIALRKKI